MPFKLDGFLALAWRPFTPAMIATCLPQYMNKYISVLTAYSLLQRCKPNDFIQGVLVSSGAISGDLAMMKSMCWHQV